MKLCKLVKEQLNHEAEFCLMPYNTLEGYTQVCTVVTYRNVEINLLFFAEKYGIKCYYGFDKIKFVWNDSETEYFECLTTKEFSRILYKANKDALILFLYSLFIRMKRKYKAAADAYDAADAASAAAAADAYDAADAAYAAAAAAAYDAAAAGKAFRKLIIFRKKLLKEASE